MATCNSSPFQYYTFCLRLPKAQWGSRCENLRIRLLPRAQIYPLLQSGRTCLFHTPTWLKYIKNRRFFFTIYFVFIHLFVFCYHQIMPCCIQSKLSHVGWPARQISVTRLSRHYYSYQIPVFLRLAKLILFGPLGDCVNKLWMKHWCIFTFVVDIVNLIGCLV